MSTKNSLVRLYWVKLHFEDCHSEVVAHAVVKIPALACISMLLHAYQEPNQSLNRII